MKINLNLNNKYIPKKYVTPPKINQVISYKKNIKNDEFIRSQIPFTSNVKDISADISEYETNCEIRSFMDAFYAYPTKTVCTGTTKLLENKYSFLYSEIHAMIRNGDEERASRILCGLNIKGPVGSENNTYFGNYVPIFVSQQPGHHVDSVDYFKEHAKKSYTDISKLKAPKTASLSEEEIIKRNEEIERTTRDYQKQLQPFVEEFREVSNGKESNLPDYIMFVTEEKAPVYLSVDQLKKDIPQANFEYIPGRFLRPGMRQEDLKQVLNNSEENYLSTNQRTIIFMPHLDDLINRRKNILKNVEQMRRFVRDANEGYRATLVFYTNQEALETLDKEALEAGVGMVIK